MSSKATVLLTRPSAQAQRFAASLPATYPVVIAPVMEIVTRRSAVDLGGVGAVILTSENGARALAELADVAELTAFCIGGRTARAATELGMQAIAADGSADALVALVARHDPKARLLHARGAETRGDVVKKLVARGFDARAVVVYDQVEIALNGQAMALLAGSGRVILPLFSPRSARLVAAQAKNARAPLAIVALSDAVASAWAGPEPESVTVTIAPTADHMKAAIATIWADLPP
ncbi:MAG: uroporphyrinogen-III synthase [Rhodobacter sp.]|nr:uroporphyrinogen-III synthase [Rhodobacter sp.]